MQTAELKGVVAVPEIQETSLPGVGVRHDFTTEEGSRIGVIHHRTGRRELFVCTTDDPDAVAMSLSLSDDDSHALSKALGETTVVENLTHLQQQIEGLAIDWLAVDPESPYSGRTIGDARIRTRTGVSVVAVIRGVEPFPAPGPEFLIEPSDTLVVVGTPEGINQVSDILMTG
ncbi:MAG TPA: cation:proton antiporter regulatory subunit [Acidimicrobiia bacterium]|nr:cation:proton antiporter regulatory subunit [Acidimicrobiia bacterium]